VRKRGKEIEKREGKNERKSLFFSLSLFHKKKKRGKKKKSKEKTILFPSPFSPF
jgi:hypothetical protein